jgi:aryl-alcohol dehydrogenase-like predicted oxidoreductase
MIASVLFGATQPAQVHENVAAAALLDRLDPSVLTELRQIGTNGAPGSPAPSRFGT